MFETELKFIIPPNFFASLKKRLDQECNGWESTYVDHYYNSQNGDTIRLRHDLINSDLTLKGKAESSGSISRRMEWMTPVNAEGIGAIEKLLSFLDIQNDLTLTKCRTEYPFCEGVRIMLDKIVELQVYLVKIHALYKQEDETQAIGDLQRARGWLGLENLDPQDMNCQEIARSLTR